MTKFVIVKSYRFEREKEITGGLKRAMQDIGALVQIQAQDNASKSPPEHPQRQSGKLVSNTGFMVGEDKDEIFTLVGLSRLIPNSSPVSYGAYLEFGTSRMPAYPWLFPAVEMKRGEIIEILKGSAKEGKAAVTGGLTWKQFTASKMGEYMRSEGGHGGAMKRLGKEWKQYKAERRK